MLDDGIPQKHPGFIDKEGLEGRGNVTVGDDVVGAVQNVEEQRFEELGIPVHLLEVETLEAGEGDGVLGIVEEKSELAAARPLGKRVGQVARQSVRQHVERPQRGFERIKVLNLFVERPISRGIELAGDTPHQDFDKKRQEVEILFCGRKAERVDGEVGGFRSDAKIRASEESCEALETAAQVEDEC